MKFLESSKLPSTVKGRQKHDTLAARPKKKVEGGKKKKTAQGKRKAMKKGATAQGEEETMKKPAGAKGIGKKLIEKATSELNEKPAELYRFVPRNTPESARGGYIMQQVVGFICGCSERKCTAYKKILAAVLEKLNLEKGKMTKEAAREMVDELVGQHNAK